MASSSSSSGCRVHFASDLVMNGYSNGARSRDVIDSVRDDDDGGDEDVVRFPTVSTAMTSFGSSTTGSGNKASGRRSKSSPFTSCQPTPADSTGCCPPPPPPICAASGAVAGGLRRTPYSPRYTSDGRLKHFPVVTQSSKTTAMATGGGLNGGVGKAANGGGPTRAVRTPDVDGYQLTPASGTATLGRRQWPLQQKRCVDHRHHHVLPFDCNSPMMSSSMSAVESVAVTECEEIKI